MSPAWTFAVAASATAAAVAVLLPPTPTVARGPVRSPWAGLAAAGLARWRARGARDAFEERLVEACGVLGEELRAGRDPGSALEWACAVCEELEPAARAHRLGGGVPAVLAEVGSRVGHDAMGRVASAWQVAHRSGRGLGEAVDALALDLRRAAASRRVVRAELASA